MIKAEKDVTTVGIEVRDVAEKSEVSVVVIGKYQDILDAMARLLADSANTVCGVSGINRNTYLGMLCGMASRVMDGCDQRTGQHDKEG